MPNVVIGTGPNVLARCDFWVSGNPVPQPRPRFDVAERRAYNRKHAVDGYKAAIQIAARLNVTGNWPVGDRVAYRLGVVLSVPVPESLPRKRDVRPCHRKPDLDNYLKAIKDALTGITWDDDGRVFEVHARKVYQTPRQPVGTRIVIEAVPHVFETSAELDWW